VVYVCYLRQGYVFALVCLFVCWLVGSLVRLELGERSEVFSLTLPSLLLLYPLFLSPPFPYSLSFGGTAFPKKIFEGTAFPRVPLDYTTGMKLCDFFLEPVGPETNIWG